MKKRRYEVKFREKNSNHEKNHLEFTNQEVFTRTSTRLKQPLLSKNLITQNKKCIREIYCFYLNINKHSHLTKHIKQRLLTWDRNMRQIITSNLLRPNQIKPNRKKNRRISKSNRKSQVEINYNKNT